MEAPFARSLLIVGNQTGNQSPQTYLSTVGSWPHALGRSGLRIKYRADTAERQLEREMTSEVPLDKRMRALGSWSRSTANNLVEELK